MAKVSNALVHRVENEKGEVIEQITDQTINYGTEPDYVKLYLKDILYLRDMPTRHTALLHELLKRSSYANETDSMELCINQALKKRIKDNLGYKNLSSINNAITDLVKGKVLIRIDNGLYTFNPYLFGKGKWSNIARLRLTVTYDLEGKSFKTECELKEEDDGQLTMDFEQIAAQANIKPTGTEG